MQLLLQELRKLIISAILATDMSYHFSLTTEFKNHGKTFHGRLLLRVSMLTPCCLQLCSSSSLRQSSHQKEHA